MKNWVVRYWRRLLAVGLLALIPLLITLGTAWAPAQSPQSDAEPTATSAKETRVRAKLPTHLIITKKTATSLHNPKGNQHDLRFELWQGDKQLMASTPVHPGAKFNTYTVALAKGNHDAQLRVIALDSTNKAQNSVSMPVTLTIQE